MIKQKTKTTFQKPYSFRVACLFFVLFSVFAIPQKSFSRDPFSPFSSSAESKKDFSKNAATKKDTDKNSKDNSISGEEAEEKKPSISITNPLVTAPLDNYKIAAVMLTPKESYAVVKAPNGVQFIAKKDDRIGNEGGKIIEITIDNVKVKNGEDEVKIPVSNFVESISVEEKELTP
jgi:Tfp pilus assembly protein PilP